MLDICLTLWTLTRYITKILAFLWYIWFCSSSWTFENTVKNKTFLWTSKRQTSCCGGKHCIIHVLDATTDSLVKGEGGVTKCVTSTLKQSWDAVPGHFGSGTCSLISRLQQPGTYGRKDWQFTASFQDQLDKWLKQHDGQLCYTDGVMEGWQVTPWQEEEAGGGTRTGLPTTN